MELDDFAGIGVYCIICRLEELARKRCSIGSKHLIIGVLQDEHMLKIFIAVTFGIRKLHLIFVLYWLIGVDDFAISLTKNVDTVVLMSRVAPSK